MSIYRMHSDIAKSPGLTVARLLLVVACLGSSATAAPVELRYPNGIVATLHGADELSSRLKSYQGSPSIELADGRVIPVVTDINDPSISNHGDGEFHPFTRALVDNALASVSHPNMPLAVRIYLLPYPRRGALVSSTTGNEIFLSPHVREIEPAVAAFIIAHELGHVFHNRFMPLGSSRWREYRELRGITDETQFNDGAAHAYRPREIFAEDFRVLFGGPDAYFGGHVENTHIAEPGVVPGLAAFYLRMAIERAAEPRIAATSSPNPFNPETEIRIVVPPDDGGVRVSVRVYSVTGALVRDLYDGSPSGDVAVRWDGRDNRGNRVVSAAYFAQIRMGNESETLKLVLLK
jgi:hypothetical protein